MGRSERGPEGEKIKKQKHTQTQTQSLTQEVRGGQEGLKALYLHGSLAGPGGVPLASAAQEHRHGQDQRQHGHACR